MTRYCCIRGCKSSDYRKANENKTRAITFFRFPKNPSLHSKWIEAIVSSGCSKDNIVKHSNICSLHFEEHCIMTNGFAPSRLKADAVPTLFFNEVQESVADAEYILPDTHGTDTPAIKAEVVISVDEDVTDSSEQHADNMSGNVQFSPRTSGNPAKKRKSYAGDVIAENPEIMSPKTLKKSVTILQRACIKKNKIINRLRVQQHRQRKKIESLKALLHELRKKRLLSSTAVDTVKAQ